MANAMVPWHKVRLVSILLALNIRNVNAIGTKIKNVLLALKLMPIACHSNNRAMAYANEQP